jgi:hypothetical protein
MLLFSDKNGTTWKCAPANDPNIFLLQAIVGNHYEEYPTLIISEKDYNKLRDLTVDLRLNNIETKNKVTEFIEELKKKEIPTPGLYSWEDYDDSDE